MTDSLPLIDDYQPSAVLAWLEHGPVTQGQFAAEAIALAALLPEARYAINLCEDRYRFMLALCAVCLRGQTNLLPNSSATRAAEDLRRSHAGSYVLNDAMVTTRSGEIPPESPLIAADHVAAIVTTSGSTGTPKLHAKSWRVLCETAQLAREVFLPGDDCCNILATVPPQHMYGLETSVFFALAAGCAVHHAKPFFPADIHQALAGMPSPRLLITTPVHLRALVLAKTRLPELALIISATAPLTAELAVQAEDLFGAPVREIYGCTEAGSMASRRPAETLRWQLHPDMNIEATGDAACIRGAHLPETIMISDQVEITDPQHFHLLGRNADMLKVAGKRASLNDLTQKLLALADVEDAAVFVPDGAERPAALVVAPTRTEHDILAALAQQVDAVFLPRPLRRVNQLPRNELGKLSRAQLLELLRP